MRKDKAPAGVEVQSASSGETCERLKVFISYSRTDTAFADEIVAGLEFDGGFDVTIDRHDIHEGEDWQIRLGALIAHADTIVFILSQKSAASPICRWEVEQAKTLSKRIIPVQADSLGNVEAPPELAALNYVRFDEGRSFMAGLAGLRRALKTDISWLREHRRLLVRAQEWEAADRADNRLLAGTDINEAKAWLQRSAPGGLQPTELHRDFLQASDQAHELRLSAERERAEKLESAVKRTRIALAGALTLAIVAAGAGLVAWHQQQAAEEARAEAEENSRSLDKTFRYLVGVLPSGWPNDDGESPDYRHIAGSLFGRELSGAEFNVTPDVIERLAEANGFSPRPLDGKYIVALRGAVIVDKSRISNVEQLRLRDVRPDHKDFRSVIVIFDTAARTMTAFQGSTVPNGKLMEATFLPALRERVGIGIANLSVRSNLLPTGLYAYVVGAHSGGRYQGVLRQDYGTAGVAVRRSFNDRSYALDDEWDVAPVFDNIHPSFSGDKSKFSSAGSITIPGNIKRDTGQHIGEWANFRTALGLLAPGSGDHGKKVDMMLVTGLDAAVTAKLVAQGTEVSAEDRSIYLERIRQGSRGDRVKKLQTALGREATGSMDGDTVKALADLQTAKLGWSDGIHYAEMDRLLGLCVFANETC